MTQMDPAFKWERAIVLGAGGGIGGALVRALCRPDGAAQVIALSRRCPPDLPTKVRWIEADITGERSLASAAAEIGQGSAPDLVIVATGILHEGSKVQPEKSWRQIDAGAMARLFEVNTIGPALAMKHFLPLLPRDRRAVFAALSARVGSIGDNRLGGWYAYRACKAALNQLVRTASVELARTHRHAAIVGLHPGTVDTALSAPFGANADKQAPEQAADALLSVLSRLPEGASGRVFDYRGEPVPD